MSPASCCACSPRIRSSGSRARHVRQPAGRAGGGRVPAPGERLPAARFSSQAEVAAASCAKRPQTALFSAAPHGVSAALIDALLSAAERAGTRPRVVDISADFRYAQRRGLRAVYATRTARRSGCAQFTCALPEHLRRARRRRTSATRAASPPRSCWRACRCWPMGSSRRRCSSAASPAAPARAASPSTARTIRCATAISTATARWRTGTRRR